MQEPQLSCIIIYTPQRKMGTPHANTF